MRDYARSPELKPAALQFNMKMGEACCALLFFCALQRQWPLLTRYTMIP